jgi:DNA-binding NtrC family response regulator
MKTILVVDDEEYMCKMVTDLLSGDYDVAIASNGVEALSKMEAGEFDLVITDLVMPGMNGIDLLMNIGKRAPGQKVIAISGGGGITGRFDYLPVAKLIGASKVLRKPFEVTELRQSVKDVLEA